eukprot:g5888.t1
MNIVRSVSRSAKFFPQSVRCMSMGYTSSHEWVDSSSGKVGITDFAQNALGDVVYVELPDVGATFEAGEVFGSVESVKAASDVYAPVSGEVVEINEALEDEPGLINTDAMSQGWFIKLKASDSNEFDSLLDEAAYATVCEEED